MRPRTVGSPRRPRTAALPVNSRTLYPLSYRGKGAATRCRKWKMDSTDGLLAALGLRPAAAQRPDRQAGQSEPTRAGCRQFCRLPPSTTWLRRVRKLWRGCTDSNRVPSVLETDALPVELHPPRGRHRVLDALVEHGVNVLGLEPRARFERATSGFVDRRSGPAELTRHVMMDDADRRQHRANIPCKDLAPRAGVEPAASGSTGRHSGH